MININNTAIKGLYHGNQPISSVYVGNTNVWSANAGQTVYFNQLINYDNIVVSSLGTSMGYSIVKDVDNHAITWTTLASASSYDSLIIKNAPTLVSVIAGHIYLSIWTTEYTSGSTQTRPTNTKTGTYGGSGLNVLEEYYGLPTDNKSICYSRYSLDIIKSYSQASYMCHFPTQRSQIKISNMMLFDLTLMFGEGKEPTAQQFFDMFPDDYYNYNPGEYITI